MLNAHSQLVCEDYKSRKKWERKYEVIHHANNDFGLYFSHAYRN